MPMGELVPSGIEMVREIWEGIDRVERTGDNDDFAFDSPGTCENGTCLVLRKG